MTDQSSINTDAAAQPLKLLRVALDPAASAAESANAAAVFARVARRAGVTFDVLAAAAAELRPAGTPPRTSAVRPPPPPGSRQMSHGKYAGRTLDDIYRSDPAYVLWVATAWKSADGTREAAAAVVRHGEGR